MTGRTTRRLTDPAIAALKPGKTEYIVWDSRVAGLGVRVRPSGQRSFVWHGHANGRASRKTVGPAALLTIEDARRECAALWADAESGANGNETCRAPLFREFVMNEWMAVEGSRWSAARRRSVGRMLEKRLLPAFGARRLDRIAPLEAERWFDAYSRKAPGGANNALQLLRQIMRAAVASGTIAADPTRDIRRNPRPKLDRFLTVGEIDRLQRTLDRLVGERPSRRAPADMVRLLLLTGCRKSEILGLKRSEVDGGALKLRETKTGPRTVWLSGAARAILDRQPKSASPYVFPSPKDPAKPYSDILALWYRARKEAGLDGVRLHDLRHTVASQAVARGVPLSTVAKMLGHADPRMTLRYAHVSDSDVQAAAERIGKTVEAAMETGKSAEAASAVS